MQKFQQQNLRLLSTNESTAESKLKNSINNFKPDQEYLNIVSMFKQKNEKLIYHDNNDNNNSYDDDDDNNNDYYYYHHYHHYYHHHSQFIREYRVDK